MKNLLILLLSVFFFSCQQKENKNTMTATDNATETDSVPIEKKDTISTANEKENKQTGDTIFMNYKNENGLFIAEGSLASMQSKVFVKFDNKDSKHLKATIVPSTGKGNIRFNQIIFPDNSSDGPFGMDLQIDLKQKGNYVLVIGHSQMADNPYIGKFNVQLDIK